MKIDPKVIAFLDKTFPESPAKSIEPLEIEIKVQKYVEDKMIKIGEYFETTTNLMNSFKNIYRAAWLPYTMLKSPLSYRMKMSLTSVEKNVEVLSNITADNAKLSVMSPSVCRAVPWMSVSTEGASGLSSWFGYLAFLTPLVYAPAMRTFKCILNGSGVNSLNIHQIQLDLGGCLERSSKIYQGPEAVVGVVTALAFGTLVQITLSSCLWMLLKDSELSYRYNTLNKMYCDVAMNLKNRWDQAIVEKNEEEMELLRTTAVKISNGLNLIYLTLKSNAGLTIEQVVDLREKLNWSCRYVTKETGKAA